MTAAYRTVGGVFFWNYPLASPESKLIGRCRRTATPLGGPSGWLWGRISPTGELILSGTRNTGSALRSAAA
jgi:hypothetical protein